MLNKLHSALNHITYTLRNANRYRRMNAEILLRRHQLNGTVTEPERKLLETYNIETLPIIHDYDYTLDLYTLDLLDQTIPKEELATLPTVKAIDVGSKNFYYAPVLERFIANQSTLQSLVGIEIDAYRVYRDLRTRYDYAFAYISKVVKASYSPIDFLEYENRSNFITMFLPFVLERPLLKWGLPLKHFKPEAIMQHAWNLLEEGGIWIITNQGEEEYITQQRILYNLGIEYKPFGRIKSFFYTFSIPQYATIITKPNKQEHP